MQDGIGQVEDLQRGIGGTSKTISKMWKLIQKGKLEPEIQKQAHSIVLHSGADGRTSNRSLADSIFNFVKRGGLFVRDPFQIETISTPEVMRETVSEARQNGTYRGDKIFSADCDGFSIYFLSIAGAAGFQGALETTMNDPDRPDEFSHVFPALLVDGSWVAYDPSTPESFPGWRPPGPMKRWHESPIESEIGGKQWIKSTVEEINNMDGLNGTLGYGYAGGDYWGSGQPQFLESPENPPLILPPDPAVMSTLVPSTPSPHRASAEEIMPDEDWLYNPNSPLMRGTETLAEKGESIMSLPFDQPYNYPYYETPTPGVSIRNGFPPGWPWSYQVEMEAASPEIIMENSDPAMTADQGDAVPPGLSGMGAPPSQFYSGYLTPKNLRNAEARSAGMGGDWYDPSTDQTIPDPSPEEIEHLSSIGGQPVNWEEPSTFSNIPAYAGWTPETSEEFFNKDENDKDVEDEGSLIKSVGEMFEGLFSAAPAVATTYGAHYLKQQEGELALQIQQAKTEAEKARAQAEYTKAMGKRYEGGNGGSDNGVPSWLLPVGIGAGVLLIGGMWMLKK